MHSFLTFEKILSLDNENILTKAMELNTNKHPENNFTLYSGCIGYSIALLNLFERSKEKKYIELAKNLIFTKNNLENNVTMYYGISGHLIAELYYYYLTNDLSVLDAVSKNVTKILSKIRFFVKHTVTNINFGDGISGFLYILSLIRQSNEKDIFDKIILSCSQYIYEYLLSENKDIRYSDIISLYYLTSDKILPDSKLILDKCKICAEQKNVIENESLHGSVIEKLFKHIIDLSIQNFIEIQIDKEFLCRNQIAYHFPRTIQVLSNDYDFSNYLGESLDITSYNFSKTFSNPSHKIQSIFNFERTKFQYEMELRLLSRDAFIKADRQNLFDNLNTLQLSDKDFLEQEYICPNDVHIIETSYYIPLEIEEDVLPAEKYWVALRPRTIPFDDLCISECCLEERFAILKTFKKYNIPIKGSDLLNIVYHQNTSIQYEIVQKFVIDVLRKLLSFRLLSRFIAEPEKL